MGPRPAKASVCGPLAGQQSGGAGARKLYRAAHEHGRPQAGRVDGMDRQV